MLVDGCYRCTRGKYVWRVGDPSLLDEPCVALVGFAECLVGRPGIFGGRSDAVGNTFGGTRILVRSAVGRDRGGGFVLSFRIDLGGSWASGTERGALLRHHRSGVLKRGLLLRCLVLIPRGRFGLLGDSRSLGTRRLFDPRSLRNGNGCK